MLPTTSPYHTPANLSRLFSFGGTKPGSNGEAVTPPPARPRAGAYLEGRQQGGPAVCRQAKNCNADLDNNGQL